MQNVKELDIIDLIEKNPISKLSSTYNGKLLNKIKENFTGFEQQLFVSSFFCYLNYDKDIDFVIDLDDVWKWLEFNQKIKAKILLEKHFKLDIDYKDVTPNKKNNNLDEKQCEILAFPAGKEVLDNENLINNLDGKQCEIPSFPVQIIVFKS